MNRYWADVSNNNAQTIDWSVYKKKGQHVLVGLKAAEGESFIDKTHAPRSQNAHKAGVWVAHYFFAHPNKSSKQQAHFFWSQIQHHMAAKDFAVLDIEVSDGASDKHMAAWCNDFDREFGRISGHSLIVYSSESFLHRLMRAGMRMRRKDAWIAAYGPHKPSVVGLRTWAWQFTDGEIGPYPHTCAGIGKCDISVLNWRTYLRLRLGKP